MSSERDSIEGEAEFIVGFNDGTEEGWAIVNADMLKPGQQPNNQIWKDTKFTVHSLRANTSLQALGLHGDLDSDGFILRNSPTAFSQWSDEQAIKDQYYPEVVALMQQVLGADKRVVVFDHTLRRRQVDEATGEKLESRHTLGLPSARQPIFKAHVDYTPLSGPQRVRDLLPDEAEELLAGRYAIIQVWRPLWGPVLDAPLAMCAAGSVAPGELVPQRIIYPHRVGHTYVTKHGAQQKWFYAPRMQASEVFVFKVYDSLDDGSVARFTPHTAFRDPTTPPDTPPRESIEVRTLVFWPQGPPAA